MGDDETKLRKTEGLGPEWRRKRGGEREEEEAGCGHDTETASRF